MFSSCTRSTPSPDPLDGTNTRPIDLEVAEQVERRAMPSSRGCKLQETMEIIKCRLGRPAKTSEDDDIFSPTKSWTPIYYAVHHQREAALAHFLREGDSPDDVHGTGQPLLCIAVGKGYLGTVKLLLNTGADVNAAMKSSGETALHLAIKTGRTDLIDLILPHRPNLDIRTTKNSETALHYAASKSGSLAIIAELLSCGAKYDAANGSGQTAAEVALHNHNLHGAIAILNAARGRNNKFAKEKEMLLKHVVKANGRFSIGNDLIADIFTAACPGDSTVLVEAIKRDDASLVEMFLDKGSDPDRATSTGHIPIFVALDCAGPSVVLTLIRHKIDVSARNERGLTVLQAALRSPIALDKGSISSIFDASIKQGADPKVAYPNGQTLLHRAVSAKLGLSRVAQLLIGTGVNVHAKDKDGNTALHLATHSRSCIDVMLKHGADPQQINGNGLTPLLFATTAHMKDTEPDLDSLVKVSDLRKTNAAEQTALHLAAANGLEKTIQSLLRARIDTTVVDANTNTPLLLAVKNHQWSAVPLLAIPPSINSWDAEGLSALHHIARSAPKEPSTWKDIAAAARPFCNRGVSRSMRDRSGATPLILAIKTLTEEGLPLIEALLSQKSDKRASSNCIDHEDHSRHDALFYAATLQKPVFVESLLRHGALFAFREWVADKGRLKSSSKVDKQSLKLFAQYEWARRAGTLRRPSDSTDPAAASFTDVFPPEDIRSMICMGLDCNSLPHSPLGTSLLWVVLRHLVRETASDSKVYLEILRDVLNNGADSNLCTIRNPRRIAKSPTVEKAEPGLSMHPLTFLLEESPTIDIDIISLLLRKGAKLSYSSSIYQGRYPLHSAVKANRIDIVDEILRQRANPNFEDNNGRTPLFSAAERGLWEIVDALLRHGSDSNAQDKEKNTPLHAAAFGGSKRIVASLLRARANAIAENAKGLTPLALVPGNRNEKERDAILLMLKDAEERSRRDQKQMQKYDANNPYGSNNRPHQAMPSMSPEQTKPSPKEKHQWDHEAHVNLLKKSAEKINIHQASKVSLESPKTTRPSLFKNPSILTARPKITPYQTAAPTAKLHKYSQNILKPKFSRSLSSVRTPSPPKAIRAASTSTLSLSRKPTPAQHTPPLPPPAPSTHSHITTITTTTGSSTGPLSPTSFTSATTTITTSAPTKPKSGPRIDSAFGHKRPADLDKPLPPLVRTTLANQTLDDEVQERGRTRQRDRDSGHELKDWLALSKMMERL